MRLRLIWLMLAGVVASLSQTTSTVSLSNGVQLKITTSLGQPAGQETIRVEMARASGNSFYRIFRDQNGLAVFGYELAVSLSSEGDSVSLTAQPLETAFAAKYPRADGGKPVPTLSEARPLPPLETGQHGEIGLFELEGQGLRVVDTVEVALGAGESGGSETFPGRLRLSALKLEVNGEPVAAGGATGTVTGRYALIYLPGRGAYILSSEFVPGRDFVKAGTIEGNKLRFVWNNESYEASASLPILSGAGNGDLWVLFDASYEPIGNWTTTRSAADSRPAREEFFAAAADTLGWWLQ